MLSTAVLRSPSFWNCFFISEIRFTFLLRLGDIGPVLRSGKLTAHEMRYCALNLLFSKIPSMEFADCDEWSDLDKAEDVCQIDGCRPSVHGVKSNKINKLPKAYGVPIGSLINLHDLIVFLEVFHMSSVSGGTSVMADKKIIFALRAEAEKRRRERGSSRTVQGQIRAVLAEILETKRELTWNQIAEVLTRKGIRWANGNKLTGKQVSNIVARLTRTKSSPVKRVPLTRIEEKPAVNQAGLRPAEAERAPRETFRGGLSPESRSLILEEMEGAKKERR